MDPTITATPSTTTTTTATSANDAAIAAQFDQEVGAVLAMMGRLMIQQCIQSANE